jgi:uncharacterized membrane protein
MKEVSTAAAMDAPRAAWRFLPMKTSAQHRSRKSALNDERLAKCLGWFSIGLGLAELLAPRQLARMIGVKNHPVLFGALGLREIMSGVGILSQRRPAGWLWSRVAGDAMDLSLLGTAYASDDADDEGVTGAAIAVAGVTILDVLCAVRLSRGSRHGDHRGIRVARSIAIDRSPEELYAFWRKFENLPQFMHHLESVRSIDEKRSHWVAKAPAGRTVEWDAEIIMDKPNELIAWRSLPGADVDHAGSVRFESAPGGRGTFIRVKIEYHPPGGRLGAAVARLFGESPDVQTRADLYRLKQLMELGHLVTTEGQPAGRRQSTSNRYDTEHVSG